MPPLTTSPAHPRQLVYIAGPLAGGTLAERQEHYRRIVALGRFAVDRGFTPIVPHLAIGALFGWPEVGETPDDRGMGLALSMALFRGVDRADGMLWVLLRDDGTPSTGTRAELGAWAEWREAVGPDPVVGTWAEWCAVGVAT